MDPKERAVGLGVVTTGVPKHVRYDGYGSTTTLDGKSVAADVSISEGRVRVVQPDGGPP